MRCGANKRMQRLHMAMLVRACGRWLDSSPSRQCFCRHFRHWLSMLMCFFLSSGCLPCMCDFPITGSQDPSGWTGSALNDGARRGIFIPLSLSSHSLSMATAATAPSVLHSVASQCTRRSSPRLLSSPLDGAATRHLFLFLFPSFFVIFFLVRRCTCSETPSFAFLCFNSPLTCNCRIRIRGSSRTSSGVSLVCAGLARVLCIPSVASCARTSAGQHAYCPPFGSVAVTKRLPDETHTAEQAEQRCGGRTEERRQAKARCTGGAPSLTVASDSCPRPLPPPTVPCGVRARCGWFFVCSSVATGQQPPAASIAFILPHAAHLP
jgi:hypothetical protein